MGASGGLPMLSESSAITVAELCRAALPLGTLVCAGHRAVGRPVRWVIAVQANGALPYLEGGELVLLTPPLPAHDQKALIQALTAAQVAAVACLPPPDPVFLALAESEGLPVLQLPAGSRIREVERVALGMLLDRQGHLERRGAQLYDQLMQLVSANAGLEDIVNEIGVTLNKTVVLQDKNLGVKFHRVVTSFAGQWDSILDLLKDRRSLPDSLSDRHKLPRHAASSYSQHLPERGIARLIAPIITQGVGRGYLSVIVGEAGPDPFDELDRIVVHHGAVICGLEMARAKAISEVQKKLRGDFLSSLISGDLPESEIQAEGDRFGHDMNLPHLAMVMQWYGEKRPSGRRLETLVNGVISQTGATTLSYLRDDQMRVFYGTDSRDPIGSARKFAGEIQATAEREFKDFRLAIGIGTVAYKVWDWRASYREAAHAADIVRRLAAKEPMYAGDLGVYTLLTRSDFREDLRALRDKMIGNLLKYDERQRADLLQTLEEFFKSHGNYTQTAEALSVHRNTLFYRMSRIQEITGLDLTQPDVRLAVHLSLKIHRLLSSE